jgi:hypothetical protein
MNLKRMILIFMIVIVGIFLIDTFIFPMQEGGCSCGMGAEISQILCAGFCPGKECVIGQSIYGWCEGTQCVTRVEITCMDDPSNTRYYRWWEPCFQCNDW